MITVSLILLGVVLLIVAALTAVVVYFFFQSKLGKTLKQLQDLEAGAKTRVDQAEAKVEQWKKLVDEVNGGALVKSQADVTRLNGEVASFAEQLKQAQGLIQTLAAERDKYKGEVEAGMKEIKRINDLRIKDGVKAEQKLQEVQVQTPNTPAPVQAPEVAPVKKAEIPVEPERQIVNEVAESVEQFKKLPRLETYRRNDDGTYSIRSSMDWLTFHQDVDGVGLKPWELKQALAIVSGVMGRIASFAFGQVRVKYLPGSAALVRLVEASDLTSGEYIYICVTHMKDLYKISEVGYSRRQHYVALQILMAFLPAQSPVWRKMFAEWAASTMFKDPKIPNQNLERGIRIGSKLTNLFGLQTFLRCVFREDYSFESQVNSLLEKNKGHFLSYFRRTGKEDWLRAGGSGADFDAIKEKIENGLLVEALELLVFRVYKKIDADHSQELSEFCERMVLDMLDPTRVTRILPQITTDHGNLGKTVPFTDTDLKDLPVLEQLIGGKSFDSGTFIN